MNGHEASRSGAPPRNRPTSGAAAARRYRAGSAFGRLPLGERAGKGSVRRRSNRARFDAVADRATARCPPDLAWRCRLGESLRQRWRSPPAGSDPAAGRALLGPDKLIGVSLHTVTEAEAIDRSVVDYAIAGPAFETPSKPGYGPEIGHKGLAEITAAAPVPVLAIGGLNATRAAEVLAAGPVGIAVMGSIMRAVDPEQEVRALLAIVAGAHPRPR